MHLTKKIFAKFTTGIFAFILLASTVFSLGINPLRSEFNIKPGTAASGKVFLINDANSEIQAKFKEIIFYEENDPDGYGIPLESDHPIYAEELISQIKHNNNLLTADSIITIKPKSKERINFKIKIPKNIAGCRFAALRFETFNNSPDGSGVKIKESVESKLAIKITGNEVYQGEVKNFGIQNDKIYNDLPISFVINFAAQGNMYSKPQGNITITDLNTGKILKKIARYQNPITGQEIIDDAIPINIDHRITFPGSERNYYADWTEDIQEGNYAAKMTLQYGKQKKIITDSIDLTLKNDLKINKFKIKKTKNSANFEIAVENNGNVYENLKGTIVIEDEFGNEVTAIDISADKEETKYISPYNSTKVIVPWLNKKIPEGKYSAVLNATYGFGQKKSLQANLIFSDDLVDYLFWGLVFGGILILILLVIIIVLLVKRRKKDRP
jgi:hypothetical protein